VAQLIELPGGGPVDEWERMVVAKLVGGLPDDYTIIPNLLVTGASGQRLEYDVVVIAPHAVYVVEVKGWRGRIHGDRWEWLLSGRRRPNPMLLTERKAKALKSELVSHAQALGRVRVEAVVVLANEQALLDLTDEGRRMVVRLPELVVLLTDPEQVRQAPGAIAGLVSVIRPAILRRNSGRTRSRRFRDYEVLETLGQTDEETVYRARRVDMPAAPEVRLRVLALSPYLLDEQERARREERLFREVEALLRMGAHPNVVTARDAFRDDDGRIVVVQEGDDARSLRQRLAGGTPLTVEERLGVLADVCRGLAHAHAHGVIHRLVTPGHVLLGEDSRARLADFGLAKLIAEGSATVWHADAIDPPDRPYLAPELRNPALGPPEPTTDLYGLGLIAWELFAGGAAPSPAVWAEPPPGMPEELAEVVGRLLHEHPAARAASASEVLALLERLRGSGVPPATGPKQVYDTGDLIDNEFEVRARLGAGGFRSVYRVYRALNDCEFALKVFNSGGFSAVRREISILQEIEHPSVERVVWAGQTGQGQWYLVTRLVEGESLAEYAGGSKHLAVEEVLAIGDQLLGALEAIHPNQPRIDALMAAARERDLSVEEADELMLLRSTGIVHRDVKPQNLLLTPQGAVLIDFNIASHAGDPAETLSGTPPYTPPDAGLRPWDPSVDLFAAGVTLYELICGVHPYDGVPSAARQPTDPRTFRLDLSPALAAFLVKACAPLAGERFATAAEMRDALAAIDAPILPVTTGDALAIPRRLADLLAAAPANVNPMVTEFLGLSSQARRSNRETRGLSELAASTYVDTRLDLELTDAVLAGRHRLVIITGNAGDGKTAFIQRVEALARERGAAFHAHGPNGSSLRLGGLLLHTLYDGSQDEESRTSDEVLQGFLAPFAEHGTDDGAARLAAVNEGRLRDFISTHRERFPGLVELLAELDNPGSRAGDDTVMLVNLNLRSVTGGGADSIFSRQVQGIVGGPFWEPCRSCDHRARCPIKHNVDTFADPVSGGEATERLRRLVDLVRLRRRRHLTMRDVRSLVSHVLFRDRDCYEVAELLASGEAMAVADIAYFQAPGGLGVPPETILERGAELLTEADVAAVASPSDDRTLTAGHTPPRMAFPRRESDYPYELVVRSYEEAGAGVEADVRLVRRAHAALRRLAFFERRDDGWLDMLPYRQLQVLEHALAVDGAEVRAKLLGRVMHALSAAQGMAAAPRGEEVLWLADGDGSGGVRGFRQFPVTDFRLQIVSRELPYVEVEPDRLELVHVPSGTVLPVDLDVLELLERLREGYVPSVDEGRGLLVHLELFFNRLRAVASSELLLMTDQGLRHIAAKPGGVVELSEVTA